MKKIQTAAPYLAVKTFDVCVAFPASIKMWIESRFYGEAGARLIRIGARFVSFQSISISFSLQRAHKKEQLKNAHNAPTHEAAELIIQMNFSMYN